jgi:hypothetical protein
MGHFVGSPFDLSASGSLPNRCNDSKNCKPEMAHQREAKKLAYQRIIMQMYSGTVDKTNMRARVDGSSRPPNSVVCAKPKDSSQSACHFARHLQLYTPRSLFLSLKW